MGVMSGPPDSLLKKKKKNLDFVGVMLLSNFGILYGQAFSVLQSHF